MTALAPPAALALAVRLLEARGFAVGARNERGDSVYLTKPPDAATGARAPIPSPSREGERCVTPGGSIGEDSAAPVIRVSNHARTARQRRKHPDVATSLVIRAPKTPAQVAAMVAAALRMVERCPASPG